MFSWLILWTKFDIRQMKHELEICGLRIFNFALVLPFFLLLRILSTYQWVNFTDSAFFLKQWLQSHFAIFSLL